MDKLLARAAPYTKLGLFGAAVGPLVDEIHNQAILQYDILPISVDLPVGIIKTSLLIPPLLAVAYVVLGGVLPQVVTRRVPSSNVIMKPLQVEQTPQFRAMAGVLSTCCIIKVSEILATNGVSAAPSIILLSVLSFLQFLALDGSYASLILAFTAAIFGPLSELPFMLFGCWHYMHLVFRKSFSMCSSVALSSCMDLTRFHMGPFIMLVFMFFFVLVFSPPLCLLFPTFDESTLSISEITETSELE